MLIHVGYKLSPVALFRKMFSLGWEQFLPFLATFVAILLTDLLKGVAVGLAVSVFFILRKNFATPYSLTRIDEHDVNGAPYTRIELAEQVSFLSKASVIKALQDIPPNSTVEIDGSRSRYIYRDVLEILHDYRTEAKLRGIDVRLVEIPHVSGAIGGH